jgi:DNA-binding protein H-NS
MMRRTLSAMSIDELWGLHEQVLACLAEKMTAEINVLDLRLKQLNRGVHHSEPLAERKPYPKVFPKFQNPHRLSETWAGRGKQPRWLTAQLIAGKCIDDFRIERAA